MHDDQLEIGEDQVRSLFETISNGYQSSADLVPGALAAAKQATRRRTIGFTLAAGALAAVGSLSIALTSSGGTVAPVSIASSSGSVSGSVSGSTSGSASGAKGASAATIRAECTGVYMPWTSGSDSSFYGKGSNSQRTTICEQDISTLTQLLAGFEVSQNEQAYSAAVNQMMPDQVTQLGSGMKPSTPILSPWQYNVVSHGTPGILMIEYSRDADGLEFCNPCSLNTPLAHGFTLVNTITGTSGSSNAIIGVQVKTPQGENIIVYLSAASGSGTPALDLVKLAKNAEFTAMLAADLGIIGNN